MIVEALQQAGRNAEFSSDWSNRRMSPGGVECWQRELSIDGEGFELERLTFPTWPTPQFSMDAAEPVPVSRTSGRIQAMHRIFEEASDVEFTLIDCGILPGETPESPQQDDMNRVPNLIDLAQS